MNNYALLIAAATNALADLEGIMPDYEPSGERTQPAWKTITELKKALKAAPFVPGTKVKFYSPDCAKWLTGKISSTEADENNGLIYVIEADVAIKSSTMHVLSKPEDLKRVKRVN